MCDVSAEWALNRRTLRLAVGACPGSSTELCDHKQVQLVMRVREISGVEHSRALYHSVTAARCVRVCASHPATLSPVSLHGVLHTELAHARVGVPQSQWPLPPSRPCGCPPVCELTELRSRRQPTPTGDLPWLSCGTEKAWCCC